MRDEILSLQEDILNGKNAEWAREQIKKLRAEIRGLQNLIKVWKKEMKRLEC